MLKTRFCKIHELVPEAIFTELGERAWLLFDDRALITLDALRELYGPVTCNNWRNGGRFSLRGYRPFSCRTGAKYSQHKFGRAFDTTFRDATPDEIRADMRANPTREAYRFIRGVEEGVSWFHFDVRNEKRIVWFKP